MKRRRKGYSEDAKIRLHQLADDLAEGSIVTKCLSRYIFQIMEFVHEEFIGPQQDRIAELEHQVRSLGGKP